MDFYQCLEKRMSCRAFLEREVDPSIIDKILLAANRSPSFMNSQPWEVFVVAGEKKEALARRLSELAASDAEKAPDLPFPEGWPESMERRIKDNRLKKFASEGIGPGDEALIRRRYLRNFMFFNAPCVMLTGVQKGLTSWSIFDLGLFVQNILSGLVAEGLGGCPQAMPTVYSSVFREELGLPKAITFVLSIPFGYPDPDAAPNRFRSNRRELSEFARYYGFEQKGYRTGGKGGA